MLAGEGREGMRKCLGQTALGGSGSALWHLARWGGGGGGKWGMEQVTGLAGWGMGREGRAHGV